MSNSQKNFLSIRSKLIAAVAMLLVASFMVVSSTYAWFTLSTAPEVTGITTQIGANGNLEIALYHGNKVENSVGASGTVDKNASWGNIVSLDDEYYGLSDIVLKPSTLSVTKAEDGTITINTANPLVTPVYGSDGRVERLSANGFYGKYATSGFVKADVEKNDPANSGYGVRALGTVSSMTHQQLKFANASTAVKTALSSAATLASTSLQANGEGLVNLILKGASGGDSFTVKDDAGTADVVEPNEFDALAKMIETLGTVPAKLAEAVQNYLYLKLASAAYSLEDGDFDTLVDLFDDAWETTNLPALANGATSITLTLPEGFPTITLPEGSGVTVEGNILTVPVGDEVVAFMADYADIVDTIDEASDAYDAATTGTTATFAQLKTILTHLMNIETITINGKKYDEIKAMIPEDIFAEDADLNDIMDWGFSVLGEGVKIYMPAGSGVYADIASISKDINTTFTVSKVVVSVGKMNFNRDNVLVNMYTTTGAPNALNPSVVPEPADRAAGANAVISDSYAYVLDFAFRTNAAGSNLMLQQEATDRIYDTNEDTESATWGGGSYMSFDVIAGSGFTPENIQNLMSNIRIVFVDTDSDTVITGAKLGTGVINDDRNNVKASVVLCDVDVTAKYLTFGAEKTEQVITSLVQNEETHISVYVYLDGVTVENEDVAAIAEFSTTGKLNLQFASDAELKPMDYSDLKNQGQTQTPANP